MNKIYEVVHLYDVDGGFGDAIGEEYVIARFTDKAKAEEIVEKYAKPHIYEKPYANLWCGNLIIREVEINTCIDESHMWWLDNAEVEQEDYDYDDYEEEEEDTPLTYNMEMPDIAQEISVEIMDYANNRKEIILDSSKIVQMRIVILSGDEILIVENIDGTEERYDSSDERIEDFYDGEYELDINADWYPDWCKGHKSYKRMDIAKGWC